MKKVKKNNVSWNQVFLIILIVLLVLEIFLIPLLVYAEVKRILPIVAFLIAPTLCGILVLLLSRNCAKEFENKKKRLLKRV